jgi:hypothetical protein
MSRSVQTARTERNGGESPNSESRYDVNEDDRAVGSLRWRSGISEKLCTKRSKGTYKIFAFASVRMLSSLSVISFNFTFALSTPMMES